MANKIHEVESMQGKVKFKEVNGKFYRIKKDGTVAKEATGRNSLLVQQILNKTKSKKSKPSYMESLHASYYTPKKPKSKKEKALTLLASVKKAKAAADAKKKNDAKGKAFAAESDKKLGPPIKKEKKKDDGGKAKLQEFRTKGGDSVIEGAFKTPKKLKDLPKKEIKTLKTKKVPTVVEKKKEKPKTPKLKAFQGSYNKDTQKLVNIDGKTFVAPKSYEKPKSETNPSFKKLMDKLGLRKGGHVDYRKTVLKGGGALMKKKTKYMSKGGMKKTKYMSKGGMKKTKYMAKGGAARRRK